MYDVVYINRTQRSAVLGSGLARDPAVTVAREEARRRRAGRMFLAGSEPIGPPQRRAHRRVGAGGGVRRANLRGVSLIEGEALVGGRAARRRGDRAGRGRARLARV